MKLSYILKGMLIIAAFACPTVRAQKIDLGKLISTGVQAVQNATATSNFSAEDLVGTWTYSSPGVNFKGENALANIGGAAAATTIENKLAPYYKKAGLDKSQLVVNQDLTFTFNLGAVKLSGTIEKTKDSDLIFNFSAFGKVNIGKVDCIATKSGSMLNLTFNASKVLAVAKKLSSVSSNSTFKTVNSMLSQYDGLYLGAKMQKSK